MTRHRDTYDGDAPNRTDSSAGAPLPNARLDDVQNDTDAMTRRGVIRSLVGGAALATGAGAVAACTDDEPTDRERARAKGRTLERTGELAHLPSDKERSSAELGLGLSGQGGSAGDGDGTAVHTLHIARSHPETEWWYDRIDMTAYGGEDATEGRPVYEFSAEALAEGGDPVILVAENDLGMLASPDAEWFAELLPERIRELAVGLEG